MQLPELKALNAEIETKVFGLIAGPAGIGKTTQATTFPVKETILISLEKGTLSIKGSGLACYEVDSYEQTMQIIENITTIAPWCKYLVIDSLAEINDLLKKESKDQFTAKQNFAKFEHMQMKFFHCIRTAKNLPISCFFICHTKEEKDGLNLVENLAFDGKMPEDIKKQFDLIIHMTKSEDDQGNKHRVFMTNPDTSSVAKRRVSPWLDIQVNDIEEPNLYKLCQKLTGQKGE